MGVNTYPFSGEIEFLRSQLCQPSWISFSHKIKQAYEKPLACSLRVKSSESFSCQKTYFFSASYFFTSAMALGTLTNGSTIRPAMK